MYDYISGIVAKCLINYMCYFFIKAMFICKLINYYVTIIIKKTSSYIYAETLIARYFY